MTACPTCQKPVDPLRAPAVAIRGGKIVAFCSASCAAVPPLAHSPKAQPASQLAATDRQPELAPRDGRAAPAPEASSLPEAGRATTDVGALERRQRDERQAILADDWLDDEPARIGVAIEEIRRARRPSRLTWVGVIGVVALGGGLALALLPSAARRERAGGQPAALGRDAGSGQALDASAPKARATPPADLARAHVARATSVLQELLVTRTSARVQRLAAAALARRKEPAALERLALALSNDNLDSTSRLEVAYALARGGDARGVAELERALTGSRDDQLTAARLFAQLGDARAIAALIRYSNSGPHRLSALEQLARLAAPATLGTLSDAGRQTVQNAMVAIERIRSQPESADARARAAIALARAGRTDLAADLQALLANDRFNPDAAQVLAELRDEAARGPLERMLETTQLRVRAARGLRTLASDFDMTPYLTRLAPLLDEQAGSKDTDQLHAAEAILLLAGEAGWATFP